MPTLTRVRMNNHMSIIQTMTDLVSMIGIRRFERRTRANSYMILKDVNEYSTLFIKPKLRHDTLHDMALTYNYIRLKRSTSKI